MNLKLCSCVALLVLGCVAGMIHLGSRCQAINPADGLAAYMMVATNCPELTKVSPTTRPAVKTASSANGQFRMVAPGADAMFLPDLHDQHLVAFFRCGR